MQGFAGQIHTVQIDGRLYVEVQDLARLTGGSISFDQERVVLTLAPDSTGGAAEPNKAAFSRPFMKAGIEAMASIRELGGALTTIVQNGYPVGEGKTGSFFETFKGRAEDSIALAEVAATNEADHRGLELLKHEFENVQGWAEKYGNARRNLSVGNLVMTENGINEDEEVQKLVQCGQFLAQMYASGSFQEGSACH